ncbi:hypothetical protein M601_005410 [Cellulophaga baltica 4]|nr:hypothetical protein M601_005410 [Cellulophaga baltica 4]
MIPSALLLPVSSLIAVTTGAVGALVSIVNGKSDETGLLFPAKSVA